MFQELLIVETWNLCHWIWHTLNPKYAPLKPFNAFAQSKSIKCKIFSCLLNSPWPKKWKKSVWTGEKVLRKAWISAHIGFWVYWLQFTMLELCVTSTFWVMMVFLNSLWQKMKKRHQFVQGKSVWKGLNICTYMFLGMLITMHYVRTLCDKYVLSYDGFFLIFDRKV